MMRGYTAGIPIMLQPRTGSRNRLTNSGNPAVMKESSNSRFPAVKINRMSHIREDTSVMSSTWIVEMAAEATREITGRDLAELHTQLGGTSPKLDCQGKVVQVVLSMPDIDEGFFTGAESAIIRSTSLVEKALATAGAASTGFIELRARRADLIEDLGTEAD